MFISKIYAEGGNTGNKINKSKAPDKDTRKVQDEQLRAWREMRASQTRAARSQGAAQSR